MQDLRGWHGDEALGVECTGLQKTHRECTLESGSSNGGGVRYESYEGTVSIGWLDAQHEARANFRGHAEVLQPKSRLFVGHSPRFFLALVVEKEFVGSGCEILIADHGVVGLRGDSEKCGEDLPLVRFRKVLEGVENIPGCVCHSPMTQGYWCLGKELAS